MMCLLTWKKMWDKMEFVNTSLITPKEGYMPPPPPPEPNEPRYTAHTRIAQPELQVREQHESGVNRPVADEQLQLEVRGRGAARDPRVRLVVFPSLRARGEDVYARARDAETKSGARSR